MSNSIEADLKTIPYVKKFESFDEINNFFKLEKSQDSQSHLFYMMNKILIPNLNRIEYFFKCVENTIKVNPFAKNNGGYTFRTSETFLVPEKNEQHYIELEKNFSINSNYEAKKDFSIASNIWWGPKLKNKPSLSLSIEGIEDKILLYYKNEKLKDLEKDFSSIFPMDLHSRINQIFYTK